MLPAGSRRCRAMGTGQFSPLSPPRRPGRQRSSRSDDGKGQGLASLTPCCHGGMSLCPLASIPGCVEVALKPDVSPVSP